MVTTNQVETRNNGNMWKMKCPPLQRNDSVSYRHNTNNLRHTLPHPISILGPTARVRLCSSLTYYCYGSIHMYLSVQHQTTKSQKGWSHYIWLSINNDGHQHCTKSHPIDARTRRSYTTQRTHAIREYCRLHFSRTQNYSSTCHNVVHIVARCKAAFYSYRMENCFLWITDSVACSDQTFFQYAPFTKPIRTVDENWLRFHKTYSF